MSTTTDMPRGRSRRASRMRRGNAQSILAAVLFALVALAPLPLGSNRPAFWALGALLLGLVATLYFGTLAHRGQSLRMDARWLGVAAVAGLVWLGWIVLQALPLGTLAGPIPAALPLVPDFALDTISLTPGPTLLAALRVAGYGLLFVLVLQVAANRNRAKSLTEGLVFMVTFWALYALLALVQFDDTILTFEKWAYQGSATGPFVNRNSFATFLAMGLVAAVGLTADRMTRRTETPRGAWLARVTSQSSLHVGLMAIVALLILATLFQTNSRMGVFAGLLGAGLTGGLVIARRGGLGRSALLVAVPLLAMLGGLAAWAYGGVLFERVGNVQEDANIRLTLYAQVLDMIAARPWLGWGLDSFESTYRAFREPPVSVEFSWARAHSTYLALWAEGGALFGSIPIVLCAWAFLACMRASLRRQSDIVLPAIGAGVILTGGVHSLVDFSLEMQANVWLFLALVALALGGHTAAGAQSRASSAALPPASPKRRRRRRRA